MAAAGQEFWIVGHYVKSCDDMNSKTQAVTGAMKGLSATPFAVVPGDTGTGMPLNAWGGFNSLVHLSDDLAKADATIDSIVHRLERQYAEVEPAAQYIVKTPKGDKSIVDYIQTWAWDEAKYCQTSSREADLKFLLSSTTKMDDEARAKVQQFNDSKTQKANISKKDAATLATRDLVDVLVPTAVAKDDFVFTEHLTTVCVILTKTAVPEFLKKYEFLTEHVVPGSAKHFTFADDKDGNSVWRVVLMKNELEAFKKACREMRVVPRDFEYSADGYAKLIAQRAQLEGQVTEQLAAVKKLMQACWSDAMVAWMHVKAMRVYVEATLRFGVAEEKNAGKLMTFTLSPSAPARARQQLAFACGANEHDNEMTVAAAEDGEEYFKYISLSFTPLAPGQK